jgi:hypothetical protein
MPLHRRIPPRRHATVPVHSSYLALKGSHADHPGVRLGPRARLRALELLDR